MNTLPTGTRLLLPSGKRGTITGTSMWDSSIYEVKIDGHDDERDGFIRDLVPANTVRPLEE